MTADALNNMEEGIKAANADTGWQDAELSDAFSAYNTNNTPQYRRVGKMVTIRGWVTPTAEIDASATTTIFTLPEGYRPSRPVSAICQGSTMSHWLLQIQTSGAVTCARYGTTEYIAIAAGRWLPFDVTFTVD